MTHPNTHNLGGDRFILGETTPRQNSQQTCDTRGLAVRGYSLGARSIPRLRPNTLRVGGLCGDVPWCAAASPLVSMPVAEAPIGGEAWSAGGGGLGSILAACRASPVPICRDSIHYSSSIPRSSFSLRAVFTPQKKRAKNSFATSPNIVPNCSGAIDVVAN